MSSGVVTFDPAAFIVQYPEFAAVAPARLQYFFNRATLLLNNSKCSVVRDLTERTILLNMLTAHVGFLLGATAADGQARPVGQVLSGTEGSVSASFANVAPQGGMAAYYAQSPYGLEYWNSTVKYRSVRYLPQPTITEGVPPLRQGRWR